MVIDTNSLILAGEVIGALAIIFGIVRTIIEWLDRQKEQDKDIKSIKEEMTLITYVLQAVLDGLHQQGCNGKVTEAQDKLSKYINQKAHNQISEE